MKRVALTLFSLLPLACSNAPVRSKFVPGPGGAMVLPIEIVGSNVVRAGEALKISNPGAATKLTVSFTNVNTGISRSRTVDAEAGMPASIVLDGSSLPDWVDDAKVQAFEVHVDNPSLNASGTRDVFVVSEAEVQPFPRVTWQFGPSAPSGDGLNLPPGKAPMVADSTQAGVDAYVHGLTEAWKLDEPEVTKAPIPRGSVTIPDWLRTMPEDIDLVEVSVGAAFSKYLVPREYSATGQLDVFSPTSLKFVLTETNPAILVTLTAVPPTTSE
jgi:hypothetical protein